MSGRLTHEGVGILNFTDNSIYLGIIKGDVPWGDGRLILKHDGTSSSPGFSTIVDGSFVNGLMHGFAVCCVVPESTISEHAKLELSSIRGSCYAGHWSQGKRHGFGRMSYSNGAIYEGCYNCGLKSGHGIMKWPDGTVFLGNWHKGKMSGPGELTFTDGTRITGVFSGKKWDLQGIVHISIPSLSIDYRGGFEGKLPYGKGVLKNEDGVRLTGSFSRGGMIDGPGEVQYPSGEIMKGTFEEGKLCSVLSYEWAEDEGWVSPSRSKDLNAEQAEVDTTSQSNSSVCNSEMLSPAGLRCEQDEAKHWVESEDEGSVDAPAEE